MKKLSPAELDRLTMAEEVAELRERHRRLQRDAKARAELRRSYERQVSQIETIEHRLTPRARQIWEQSNRRKLSMLRGETSEPGEVERFTTNSPVEVYRR